MSPRRVLVVALTVLGLVAVPALPASAALAPSMTLATASAGPAAAAPLAAASSSWPRVKQKLTAGTGAGFTLKAKKTRTVKVRKHKSVPSGTKNVLVKVKVMRSKGAGSVKIWANGTKKSGLKTVRYGKGTTVKTVKVKTSASGRIKLKSTRGVRVKIYTIGYKRPAKKTSTSATGAGRTGVPAGTKLKVHNGDLTISKRGAVVDGLDVRGFVRVTAPGVTIKNSVIRGRATSRIAYLVQISDAAKGATIIDSELRASHASPYVMGVVGAGFTLKRVNIHRVIDQVAITGDNVTIEDSWLHGNLYYKNDPNHGGGESHDDNIQIQAGKNIRIVGNRLESSRSAALMITQGSGPVGNVTFARNRVDGGSCSVNIAEKSHGPLSGLRFVDNVFGTGTRHAYCAIIKPTTTPMSQSGNSFTDGQPFRVSRG